MKDRKLFEVMRFLFSQNVQFQCEQMGGIFEKKGIKLGSPTHQHCRKLEISFSFDFKILNTGLCLKEESGLSSDLPK